MGNPAVGFQPRNTPAERRAFFDQKRQLGSLTDDIGGVTDDVGDLTDQVAGLVDSKVDIAGDVMTGYLTLSADPTIALHAATKQYIDQRLPKGPWGTGTPTVQNIGASGTIISLTVDAQPVAGLAIISAMSLHQVSDGSTRFDMLLSAGSLSSAMRGAVGVSSTAAAGLMVAMAASTPLTIDLTATRIGGAGTLNILADGRFWNIRAFWISTA